MITTSVLDEVIQGLQPEDVPFEFIIMAKVVDMNGIERIIRGKEMEAVLVRPDHANISEARVILDVRKIRLAIITEVNEFFTDLNQRLSDLDLQ